MRAFIIDDFYLIFGFLQTNASLETNKELPSAVITKG